MTKRDQFPRLPLALGDENDAQRDSMTKKKCCGGVRIEKMRQHEHEQSM